MQMKPFVLQQTHKALMTINPSTDVKTSPTTWHNMRKRQEENHNVQLQTRFKSDLPQFTKSTV